MPRATVEKKTLLKLIQEPWFYYQSRSTFQRWLEPPDCTFPKGGERATYELGRASRVLPIDDIERESPLGCPIFLKLRLNFICPFGSQCGKFHHHIVSLRVDVDIHWNCQTLTLVIFFYLYPIYCVCCLFYFSLIILCFEIRDMTIRKVQKTSTRVFTKGDIKEALTRNMKSLWKKNHPKPMTLKRKEMVPVQTLTFLLLFPFLFPCFSFLLLQCTLGSTLALISTWLHASENLNIKHETC